MTIETMMTGAEREVHEANELATAEAAYNGETMDLHPQDNLEEVNTPNEPAQIPDVDWEKRYKDLQSHSDKTTSDLKNQIKELSGVVPTTEEEVAALRTELESLKGIEQGRETENLVSEAQRMVGDAHPDFVGVIQSTDFAEWIKTQPEVFQNAIYDERPDAQMAINALTLFKTNSGFNSRQEASQQQQMLDQAAMSVNSGHREQPQVSSQKEWTYAEISTLSPSQYELHEAEIDQAIVEGRVR